MPELVEDLSIWISWTPSPPEEELSGWFRLIFDDSIVDKMILRLTHLFNFEQLSFFNKMIFDDTSSLMSRKLNLKQRT